MLYCFYILRLKIKFVLYLIALCEHFLLCCASPVLMEILEIHANSCRYTCSTYFVWGSVLNAMGVDYLEARQRIERQTRRLCKSLHVDIRDEPS